MAILTAGFHRTKGHIAFYIESSLHFVSTGNLSLGFRIVYRLIFRNTRGILANPAIISQQGREAFIKIFGLDENHIKIQEPVMCSSVLWEAYWDKGDLDLRKIHRCDIALNIIAKRNQVAIEHVSTTIMVRELSYLQTIEIQL